MIRQAKNINKANYRTVIRLIWLSRRHVQVYSRRRDSRLIYSEHGQFEDNYVAIDLAQFLQAMIEKVFLKHLSLYVATVFICDHCFYMWPSSLLFDNCLYM